jgi:MFS family permease
MFFVILRFEASNDPLLCGSNTDSLLLCFITGVGTSMIHCLTLVMISAYFDKRRGFANSLANVGGSVGGFVFPVLIRALLNKYDLQGALIVLSGIMLNTVIVELLGSNCSHLFLLFS